MDKAHQTLFWFSWLFALLLINENTVQWMLAVIVGKRSFAAGYGDAFEYFSVPGYLFFTGFRSIPYLALAGFVRSIHSKKPHIVPGIAWGGLAGIVFAIIWGAWFAQYALYTDAHDSSTMAIAFIFIPFYVIVPGVVGGLLGWAYCALKCIQKVGDN